MVRSNVLGTRCRIKTDRFRFRYENATLWTSGHGQCYEKDLGGARLPEARCSLQGDRPNLLFLSVVAQIVFGVMIELEQACGDDRIQRMYTERCELMVMHANAANRKLRP